VSIQDTKERIFMNGQIYSRPRFGGPVGSPDNRRFTPDPNPYGVEPEPRGYGQGTVDTFEVLPLDFMNQYINNRGITEQNQEVMGSKEQVFPRYANPEDGTLNNTKMAELDPTGELLLRSLRRGEIGPLTDPNIRKAIKDLERQKYGDGRASIVETVIVAEAPGYGPEIPQRRVGDVTERFSPGYEERRDAIRQRIAQMRLRGV
jgi:hypothetical protein